MTETRNPKKTRFDFGNWDLEHYLEFGACDLEFLLYEPELFHACARRLARIPINRGGTAGALVLCARAKAAPARLDKPAALPNFF